MEFLYPNMLYALFALIIPIIIHLFNFRRHKVVYFSNTSVLKTIEQQNSKTKKLKYIITLIMRMLFIAALVIAFAFPYKKDSNTVNDNVDNLIAVYIDNSMSMKAHSSEMTLYDDARSSAKKLVENLNQSQKYILLSNDRDPKNEYPMNKDEMLISLNEMKSESAPASFEEIYNSLSFIKKKHDFASATLFSFSDYQKNMMLMDDLITDTAIQVVAFPLHSDFQNNIYIDSVWLQSPVLQKNMTNELGVRIVNETPNDVKGLPVNFSLDENIVAYTTCDITANSYSDVNMQFVIENEGDRKAKVSINDSPITFDDEYNLVLKVRPVINVVEIKPDNISSPLEILFKDDILVNYQSMNPYMIDNNILINSQMIVVNENSSLNETLQQTLLEFAEEGGSLALFTNDEDNNDYLFDKLSLSRDMSADENLTKIEFVAQQNPFFDDVFLKLPENAELPDIQRHIPIHFLKGANSLNLLTLMNGDPLLLMSPKGKGRVFMFSVPLNEQWSDLPNHAFFVPLMYKMALLGGDVSQFSYTLGLDKYLNINDISLFTDDRLTIKSENGLFEMYPVVEMKGNKTLMYFFEDLPSSGFYDIYKNGTYISTVAWNDDRKESQMSFYDKDEMLKLFADNRLNILATIDYDDISSGDITDVIVKESKIWKLFVIIALAALLIEILILRFWKD